MGKEESEELEKHNNFAIQHLAQEDCRLRKTVSLFASICRRQEKPLSQNTAKIMENIMWSETKDIVDLLLYKRDFKANRVDKIRHMILLRG